jgi:predicted XRE-type DNA-binding protein
MKKSAPRIDNKDDHVITHGSDNIFIDLGFDPAEAKIMHMRTTLMLDIRNHLKAQPWTQAETARHLSITQPRVSKLIKGRSKEFSIEMLLLFATRLGLKPELRLKSSPHQRLAA